MTAESRLREEICTIGENFYRRGYCVGSAGNISARLEDGWLITPTDACLGRLDPVAIAKVSSTGEWLSGARPSKTLTLHRRIYERATSANAVVHTHSTALVALTLLECWRSDAILPPITPYQVMKVGRIPLIRYRRPGASEVADEVAQLAAEVRGVMLERLGPVLWESSVSRASYALEELEETARLWLQTTPRPAPLPDAAVAELSAAFGASW